MAVRHDTILMGLVQERDRILEILNHDASKLKADLAATERLIAIYTDRAEASTKANLPKSLKAAAKIRIASNGHEHGNGNRPKQQLTNKQRIAEKQRQLLAALDAQPHSKTEMIALMQSVFDKPTGRGVGTFTAKGFLARNKAGVYSITAKGKRKLAELTGRTDEHAAGSTD